MDFQFKLNTPSATVSADSQSLLEMSEQIRNQYQELLALESKMEEFRGIVNDIEFVASAVEQYGDKAIPILNSNSRVSKLIGSAEGQVEQLTAKLSSERIAATEGFLDNVKALGKKLVEFIKNLINKIRQFFAAARGDEKAIIYSITDDQISSCIKKTPSFVKMAGSTTSDGVYQAQGYFLGVDCGRSRVFRGLEKDSTRTQLSAVFKSIGPHIGEVSGYLPKLRNVSPTNNQGLSWEDVDVIYGLVKNLNETRDKFEEDFDKESSKFEIRNASDLVAIYEAVLDFMKTAEDLLTKIDPIAEEIDALCDKFFEAKNKNEPMLAPSTTILGDCDGFCYKSAGLLSEISNAAFNTQRGCVKLAKYIAKNA